MFHTTNQHVIDYTPSPPHRTSSPSDILIFGSPVLGIKPLPAEKSSGFCGRNGDKKGDLAIKTGEVHG